MTTPPLIERADGWGVTLDKDLVLDTSGVGQLFGLGPEVPAGDQLRDRTPSCGR